MHHFSTNKDLDRTGHNVCHVVTQKIKLIFLSSNSPQRSYSGECTLLTEAAVASSSEVQNFKCDSSSHVVSVPALSGPTERGFLGACEPLKITGRK